MSYLDYLAIAIVVLAFSMVVLTGALVTQNIFTGLLNSSAITPSMPTYKLFTDTSHVIYSLDLGIVLLYFGMCIISVFAAAYLESEPINLPLSIFFGIVTILISFVISNAAHAIMGSSEFSSVIGSYPNTLILFADLPVFTALFILLYAAVIIARPYIGSHGSVANMGGGGGVGF